jgi:RNA polymerase sigma factor (TIGR02999 family)
MGAAPDITALLDGWSRGDANALRQLLPLVYAELRAIAARELQSERRGHTLQPTALVHEVYLRLTAQREVRWQNRAHFFGIISRVMRRVLVDYARRHHATKRGDGVRPLSIQDVTEEELIAPGDVPVLGLNQALDRLERVDADLAKIVELRVFGGLTIEEAAEILNVSPSTAKREWRVARAWLTRELGETRR